MNVKERKKIFFFSNNSILSSFFDSNRVQNIKYKGYISLLKMIVTSILFTRV